MPDTERPTGTVPYQDGQGGRGAGGAVAATHLGSPSQRAEGRREVRAGVRERRRAFACAAVEGTGDWLRSAGAAEEVASPASRGETVWSRGIGGEVGEGCVVCVARDGGVVLRRRPFF